jgi:hypothetical protein
MSRQVSVTTVRWTTPMAARTNLFGLRFMADHCGLSGRRPPLFPDGAPTAADLVAWQAGQRPGSYTIRP